MCIYTSLHLCFFMHSSFVCICTRVDPRIIIKVCKYSIQVSVKGPKIDLPFSTFRGH